MKKLAFVLLCLLLLSNNISQASTKAKSLKPAPNYQFIFVHGVSSWDQEWSQSGTLQYFESELGVPASNIHAYSFSDPEQSAYLNAREFGDRSYTGTRRKFKSAKLEDFETFNVPWLDKAQSDFRDYYETEYKKKDGLVETLPLDGVQYSAREPEKRLPPNHIPTQNIVYTHSGKRHPGLTRIEQNG